ncbi:MAG TPA: hypothetical protein VFI31_09200, partial [Pirellulales bacterium]|nr:hypothetical protein [Pirellulales bacterium]
DATRKRGGTDEVVAARRSSGQSSLDRDKPGSGRNKTSVKRTRGTSGISAIMVGLASLVPPYSSALY